MSAQYALSVMGNHIASLWADRLEPRDAKTEGCEGFWLYLGDEMTGCLTIRPGVELLGKDAEGHWRPVALSSVNSPDATQKEHCATAQPAGE